MPSPTPYFGWNVFSLVLTETVPPNKTHSLAKLSPDNVKGRFLFDKGLVDSKVETDWFCWDVWNGDGGREKAGKGELFTGAFDFDSILIEEANLTKAVLLFWYIKCLSCLGLTPKQ